MNTVTVTIKRGEQDITVVLVATQPVNWFHVLRALDEAGTEVVLTAEEFHQSQKLARSGVDETGR